MELMLVLGWGSPIGIEVSLLCIGLMVFCCSVNVGLREKLSFII